MGATDPFKEQRWAADQASFIDLVEALGVPLPAGFHPVGLTAVLVAVNDRGQVAPLPAVWRRHPPDPGRRG